MKQNAEGQKNSKKRGGVWKILAVLLLAVIILCGVLWHFSDNSTFEVTFYRVSDTKIGDPIRAVLLADLHNGEFGDGNEELTDTIISLEPDIILMAGDMVNGDEPDISAVMDLCESLAEAAPIYYILGNNEGELIYEEGGPQVPLDLELQNAGVQVLYDGWTETELNGNQVIIGAAPYEPEHVPEDFPDFIREFGEEEGFKILISHYPSMYYELLAEARFDLAVAGHFHGGLIRLPNGAGRYHVDEGIFPKYCYGKFALKYGDLIVSRGLGSHDGLPRINNRPELVVIDISHT